MQIDMHYHAAFCMAYAAGFTAEDAQQIATASQFVDDNNSDGRKELEFKDGSAFYLTATAHHPSNLSNLDDEEQRTVWVPFHFIPGNEGDSYMERLITTKNSQISKDIVANAISGYRKPYHLQFLGIVSHCYADTFSHYGFSGLASPLNTIILESIVKHDLLPHVLEYVAGKEEGFISKYGHEAKQATHRFIDFVTERYSDAKSTVANMAALGHGAALTYPDRPYLNWEFRYEVERIPCTRVDDKFVSIRNNPETFLEACEKLHQMYSDFIERNDDFPRRASVMEFKGCVAKVKEIILFQGTADARKQKWSEAFEAGYFGEVTQPFPEYLGQDWLEELDEADGHDTAEWFMSTDVFKFYQAAEQHRAFVLRELLPSYGIAVK